MRNFLIYLGVLSVLVFFFLRLAFREPVDTSPDPADMVLSGGAIYTGIDTAPRASAVAVRDGRIIYVGDAAGVAELIGDETRQVDLAGAALYPGFTDGHAHLLSIGLREMTLNLDDVTSIEDLKERIAAEAENTPRGQAIIGRGWIETHWPEDRFPTRDDLDAAAPNHPVLLERADGHAMVVNSLALERAGITASTEAPFGGEILKDANGLPNGMLIDSAMELVSSQLGELTQARRRAAYIKASDVYTALGWTGIHNMSVDPQDVPLMEELAASGELQLRVYNSLSAQNAFAFFDNFEDTPGDLITTRAIKLYADGALGSRGAALLEPYDDAPGSTGLITLKEEDTLPFLKEALTRGIQINTHAIGDRGNRLVLDWYERVLADTPEDERAVINPRWRVEHAQVLDLDDLPRFAELDILPSMQPSHAIGDLHFAVDRVGVERLQGAYAWHSLIDSGVPVIGGSDAPVEKGDPRIEFYAAIARKDLSGFSGEGWYPQEAVSRSDALKMFTSWPAYGAFAENQRGEISVGKQADFTVFGADIMKIDPAEILTVPVVMTIVDGEIVYEAPTE